jgi:hypothetical protein
LSAPAAGRARETLAAVAVSLVLLLWYRTFDLGLPTGGAEFVRLGEDFEPLPFAPLRGFTFDQLARHAGRLFILGPALVLLSQALAAARHASAAESPHASDGTFGVPPRLLAFSGAAAGLGFALVILVDVLRGRALSDLELAIGMQAGALLDGALAIPAPGWGEHVEPRTLALRESIAADVLFGEPLVQVAGASLGLPALGHIPILAAGLWAWHRTIRGAVDAITAAWATVLLGVSPLLVFTAATGVPHATALVCLAFVGLGAQLAREGRWIGGPWLAGAAAGFGLAVEASIVAPFGAVLLGALGRDLLGARRWAGLGALLAGFAPWVLLLAWWSTALTGEPWGQLGRAVAGDWPFGFGGVVGVDPPFVHTPGRALENLAVNLARFNGWWLGWPASLALAGVWLAVGAPRRGLGVWAAGAAVALVVDALRPHPGRSDTGPISWIALLFPASLVGAGAIVAVARRHAGVSAAALGVHLLIGTTTFYAEHATRLGRLADAAHRRVERALRQVDAPALLFAGPPATRIGWIDSDLPLRTRREAAPVLTWPLLDADARARLSALHPDRGCWVLPGGEELPVPCAAYPGPAEPAPLPGHPARE